MFRYLRSPLAPVASIISQLLRMINNTNYIPLQAYQAIKKDFYPFLY